jgi:hypothetical protein
MPCLSATYSYVRKAMREEWKMTRAEASLLEHAPKTLASASVWAEASRSKLNLRASQSKSWRSSALPSNPFKWEWVITHPMRAFYHKGPWQMTKTIIVLIGGRGSGGNFLFTSPWWTWEGMWSTSPWWTGLPIPPPNGLFCSGLHVLTLSFYPTSRFDLLTMTCWLAFLWLTLFLIFS